MSSLVTYGRNIREFNIGGCKFNYSYQIPVNQKKGANYNSGYIEGYQRALYDLQRNANKMFNNNRLSVSFYNWEYS